MWKASAFVGLVFLLAGCASTDVAPAPPGTSRAVDNGVVLDWTPADGDALHGELTATNTGATTWHVWGSSSCDKHLTWRVEDAQGNPVRTWKYVACTTDYAHMTFAPRETKTMQVAWDGMRWDDEGKSHQVERATYQFVARVVGQANEDQPNHRYDTVVELRLPFVVG